MDQNNVALSLMNQQKIQVMEELRACNDFTARFGLILSEQQMQSIAAHRLSALKDTGRIEFGQGILKKLLYAFYDSPYIMQENYEETIYELLDSFYYFKNESHERISDDELIETMKKRFDGVCQGSLDFLSGMTWAELSNSTDEDEWKENR